MNVTSRTLIGASVVSLLLTWTSTASGSTRVVFTVDVESNKTYRLPDQIDTVCKDGSACGLMEIVRLLEARHWPGTFYLNVYEHPRWGPAAMRDIAARLQAAGQDVALHTHPETAYDPLRTEMYQYSLDEQTAIIRDGARLITAWTGRPAASHRAGDYSADENTLIALERNGVLVDSSRFWENPSSRLGTLGLPRNLPSWYGRVAEIPVTVYQREDRLSMLGAVLPPLTAVRKVDVNWLVDETEMRGAIDAAVASDLPVLVVFLHSFSFLGERTDSAPVADHHAMDMFRAVLDHIALKQLPVVTMRELATEAQSGLASGGSDVVPRVTVRVDLPHYAWRWVKASEGLPLTVSLGLVLLSVGGVIILARRRRVTARGTHPDEAGVASRLVSTGGVRSR